MPLTIPVPSTYALRPKRTASLYLVFPGIMLLFCLIIFVPSISLSLWKLIYNRCRSPSTHRDVVIYVVVIHIVILVHIVINLIIREKLCYFVFTNKDRLIFIFNANCIKFSVASLVIDATLLTRLVLTPFQVLFVLVF